MASQAASQTCFPFTPVRIASVDRFTASLTVACMCRRSSGASPKQNVRVMSAQNRLSAWTGKMSTISDSPGRTGPVPSSWTNAPWYRTERSVPMGETLDEDFFHGLGHGVGLEVHEAPNMGLSGDDLIAGDVVTIEPGVYRKDFGGVRLEDLAVVRDDGAEVLTDFPYD